MVFDEKHMNIYIPIVSIGPEVSYNLFDIESWNNNLIVVTT